MHVITPPPPPPPSTLASVVLKPLATSVLTNALIWLVPALGGVLQGAWWLLAIFLATIVGIITQLLLLDAVVLLGLDTAVLTKTLTFVAAFSAFGDPIPWLIAMGFFFTRGFIKAGLGKETERSIMKRIKRKKSSDKGSGDEKTDKRNREIDRLKRLKK